MIGGITIADICGTLCCCSILIDRGLLIPGVAMTTLEKITCAIPFSAALFNKNLQCIVITIYIKLEAMALSTYLGEA